MLEGKRVLQVSFDVVVPEDYDGYDVAVSLASEINCANNLVEEVLGYDFKSDVTKFYRDSWF